MKKRVVIAGSVRTAIGRWQGSLIDVPAEDLLALVFQEAIKRSGVDPKEIDGVRAGCCVQTADAPNIAKVAALKAGVPVRAEAVTVQRNCASGIDAITSACQAIRNGDGEVFLVGGTENMSAAPYSLKDLRRGVKDNRGSSLAEDGIWKGLHDPTTGHLMGTMCEKVAEKYSITAEEQDAFAAKSQQKAVNAQKEGKFRSQIIPVMIKRMGREVPFVHDEAPRPDFTSKEKVAMAHDDPRADVFSVRSLYRTSGISKEVKRIFSLSKNKQKAEELIEQLENLANEEKGTITGLNSCAMSDGAAAMIVMTEKKAKKLGITPEARIVSYAYAATDPVYFGEGPIYAIPKALKKAGLEIEDIDFFEINEAFAAQCLPCQKVLGIQDEKLNVWGGAIALGHPVGATGSILTVKLIYLLREYKARYGLASMCVGGGQGGALIIENYLVDEKSPDA